MFRLIAAPFRLLRWCLFTACRIIVNHIFLFAAIVFAIVMMVLERWSWGELGWYFLGLWLSLIAGHCGLVVFRPGSRRGAFRIPVAAVLVKARKGKGSTVRMALGRLDPALRRLIETPPPAPATRP